MTGGGDTTLVANLGLDEQGAGRAFTQSRGPAPVAVGRLQTLTRGLDSRNRSPGARSPCLGEARGVSPRLLQGLVHVQEPLSVRGCVCLCVLVRLCTCARIHVCMCARLCVRPYTCMHKCWGRGQGVNPPASRFPPGLGSLGR